MKTSSAKAKGRRLQQEVVAAILDRFSELEPDDVRCTAMGQGGEDVQLSPAARNRFPVSIECKNTERLQIWKALEQAEANAGALDIPLVVFKRNRSKTYACLELEHLLRLVE